MSEGTITSIVAESGTHNVRKTGYADLTVGMRVLLSDGAVYVTNGWKKEGEEIFLAVTGEDTGEAHVIPLGEDSELAVIVDGAPTGNGAGNDGDVDADEVDLRQCSNNSPSGRRCKLPASHNASPDKEVRKHRYVLRDADAMATKSLAELRKTEPKLKGFKLSASDIPADADVSRTYSGKEIERDADQKKVDADAEAAYNKWVKAGWPKGTFEDVVKSSGKRYIIPPEAFDAVTMMLRRSTQKGAPTAGKKLSYRRQPHDSGNVILMFVIADEGAVKAVKGENSGNGTGA